MQTSAFGGTGSRTFVVLVIDDTASWRPSSETGPSAACGSRPRPIESTLLNRLRFQQVLRGSHRATTAVQNHRLSSRCFMHARLPLRYGREKTSRSDGYVSNDYAGRDDNGARRILRRLKEQR